MLFHQLNMLYFTLFIDILFGGVLWQLWQHRRHLLHALLLAEMAWDKPWPHSKHGSSIQTCLILSQTPISHHVYTYPLVIKHGLRENPPFIDEFPIKNTFIGFWIVWLPERIYVLFEPCGMLFYPPHPALRPTSANFGHLRPRGHDWHEARIDSSARNWPATGQASWDHMRYGHPTIIHDLDFPNPFIWVHSIITPSHIWI